MICPKCGEDNADTFRFCGMCGNLLEARKPVGALISNSQGQGRGQAQAQGQEQRSAKTPEMIRPAMSASTPLRPANRSVPPISGPSMLGLNEPVTDQARASEYASGQAAATRSRLAESDSTGHSSAPGIDSLRDRSFSGLNSFYEPEQPKSAGRRALIFIVLLVALGAAGWWVRGYLAGAESRKSETITQDSNKSAAGNTTNTQTEPKTEPKHETPAIQSPAPETAPATNTKTAQVPSLTAAVPEGPSESASVSPNPDVPQTSALPAAKPTQPPAREIAKNTRSERTVESRKSHAIPKKTEQLAVAANTGDADFRKGEAYLYGRGARENCTEAVKSLKAASAQSNAKARSAFGTMYATGHCVPRDLPTSYLWFALALRVDPNNQILEKDLNAVWNQMTPPERQMATRMKQ